MSPESTGRILIVEDDEAIRESLTAALQDFGYAADSAVHGQQALERLRGTERLPQLILLDLAMPVMDGFQLSHELAQDSALRAIPIVIMSADGQLAAKVARTGARGYLKKPMSLDAVLEVVTRWLGPVS
jgi:CheY-like chemotaxis protein